MEEIEGTMGLVQYDSSDEDEEVQTPVEPKVRPTPFHPHQLSSMLTTFF